ncbi:hypothetical protein C2845_PM09G09200 [Panicum miliaceum]|uniref:F-box/kelch-repeat protein n=1 Tax=Panicum miliaceum TaxID=4540 RepID=A0A3L6RWM1_PANMI|nr:hypothetical protein C2845_PM09G09200 [Panicum miliaceum]
MMPDSDNSDSLYILDMVPARTCSFEVLSYNPVEEWSWRPLPLPPFFDDPEYKVPDGAPFTVVDGTSIWVSTTTATYSFDTLACEWSKVGDWVLPFNAEYVSELGLWLGLSDHRPYNLCALEGLSTSAVGSSPPTELQVGKEFEPPDEDWLLLMHTLVNVGSCRFCIVSVFDVITEHNEYDSIRVVVFTGVEVSPSQPGLRMIRHKTKFFIGGINHVL